MLYRHSSRRCNIMKTKQFLLVLAIALSFTILALYPSSRSSINQQLPRSINGDIVTSAIPATHSNPGYAGSTTEYTSTRVDYLNKIDYTVTQAHPIGFTMMGININVSGLTGSVKDITLQDTSLYEADMPICWRNTGVSPNIFDNRGEFGSSFSFTSNIKLKEITILMIFLSTDGNNFTKRQNMIDNIRVELRANATTGSINQPSKSSILAWNWLNTTNINVASTSIKQYVTWMLPNDGYNLLKNKIYWFVLNVNKSFDPLPTLLWFNYGNVDNHVMSNRSLSTVGGGGDAQLNLIRSSNFKITNASYDYYMLANYAITDPFNVTQIALNGTVNGIKKSFTHAGLGSGTASWSGLSLTGSSATLSLESKEPLTYNATTTGYYKKVSPIQYTYTANSSSTVSWRLSFSTISTGTGYNITAGYHPRWSSVKIALNGTDVTGSCSISNGNIAIPPSTAGGSSSWTITAESYNTVSSLSFVQSKYYRGQTFSVSIGSSMTPTATDLISYYDSNGSAVGSTVGTNFPLGTYTAIYWCENGTDAGWKSAEVPVTDNGSISVHVTDSLSRAVPGISVKIRETGATQTTSVAGDATFINVEYGTYTLYAYDTARGINETISSIAVNAASVQVNHQLSRQWAFPVIPVAIRLADKFNDGFPGVITIANQSRVVTTMTIFGTASSGGYFTTALDEGTYGIAVQFGGRAVLLNQSSFTVERDASSSFIFNATMLDAHPPRHEGTVDTCLKDSLGRPIPGMIVIITSVTSVDSGTTSSAGSFSPLVYWGNGTGVDVEWKNGTTSLGARSVTIAATGSVDADLALGYQWRFAVPITIQLHDRFASGFPGIITIRNATSGAAVSSAAASAAGAAAFSLLETASGALQYNITIDYPTRIYTALFGVLQGNGTWVIDTAIDAYPSVHSTTVETSIKDSLARWIDGINVTLVGTGWSGAGITDSYGTVTFYNVYWGTSTSFTVTWRTPGGTILNSSVVMIAATSMKILPTVLASQYIYTGLIVIITAADKFGSGFPAVLRYPNDTVLCTCASSGTGSFITREQAFTNINVFLGTKIVSTRTFTVVKDAGQAFAFSHPALDSSPGAHAAALVAHLQDNASRNIYGVTCRVAGIDGTWQSMTGTDGNATVAGCYWGNSTSFTVSWIDGSGTFNFTLTTMSSADVYYFNQSLHFKYTFKNLPVSFNFTDKINLPFPAFVSFFKNGAVPSGSGAAGANGYFQTVLDEGSYVAKVEYPSGTFVGNRSFTVNLANSTVRYNFNFPGFSSQIKICTMVVNIKDALGRNIYPIMIRVNGTGIDNATITDGGGSALFTRLAYQDHPDYTIRVYFDEAGTLLVGTIPITITSDQIRYNYTAPVQFHFPDIVTTFTVVDHFAKGYRANVTILDSTNTTAVVSSITTDSGRRVLDLDEGMYTAVVRDENGASIIEQIAFTVLKDAANSPVIQTGIDAYPGTHASPVTITAKDSLGRFIEGLDVAVASSRTSCSVASADGIYRFLSVYWAFDQWFNVTIRDGTVVLGAFQLRVNGTASATWTKPGQYIFRGVPIQLEILDVHGRGFAADVEIRYQNGSAAWSGQSPPSGIINAALDEGNYTAVAAMLNGTAAGSASFEVRRSTGVSFSVHSPVDAYPPGFQLPWWAYLAIVGITAVVFVSIYKARHEKRERRFRDTMSKRKYFEDVEGFRMCMCIHDNTGVELATYALQVEQKEKAVMAAGLINALGSFGKEIDAKTSQMDSFHYKEWSANLFHGKYCTFALLTESDIGAAAREKMRSFVEQYERDHDDVLSRFSGNVTTFDDFAGKFNAVFGTELLDPCLWKMKEITAMPRVNPVLYHHLRYLIDKARIKYPSLKDLLVTLRARDRAPPDTIYDALYDIYMNGYVVPAKHDTKQSLVRYMIGAVKSASVEEIKEFQDALRAEIFERGKIIDDLDKKIEGAEPLVGQGRLTPEQMDILVKKCAGLRDTASKELDALEGYTFERWKTGGKQFSIDQQPGSRPASPGSGGGP